MRESRTKAFPFEGEKKTASSLLPQATDEGGSQKQTTT